MGNKPTKSTIDKLYAQDGDTEFVEAYARVTDMDENTKKSAFDF
jgi:hypothetical protein